MGKSFELVNGNVIHPTAEIHPNAKLGEGNRIGRHVIIHDGVEIGDNNTIGDFCSIGGAPQHRTFTGNSRGVKIGDNNQIRDFCQFHAGTLRRTKVGNGCYIMSYVHAAHDVEIGSHVTLCNKVQISGLCTIDDYATISTGVDIEQRTVIGQFAFVGLGHPVSKSLAPFGKYVGNKRIGENSIGIERWIKTLEPRAREDALFVFEHMVQATESNQFGFENAEEFRAALQGKK